MRLDSDDFVLFGVPAMFALDASTLDARRRDLQSAVHPDRFASEGVQAQRLALQWAVRVNEAYQRLRDPLRRAAYLCERHGVDLGADSNTTMPVDFLTEQMSWREALDDADTPADVDALKRKVSAYRDRAHARLGSLLDTAQDFAAAAQQVRALMFVERFAADVAARLDRVEFAARMAT